MKIVASYSKTAFESTIDFIAKNNEFFRGQHEKIRESLLHTINDVVTKDHGSIGTMGYYVIVIDRRYEGLEHDQNTCFIEFRVDPDLGKRDPENEYVEVIYDTNKTGSV